MINTFFPNSRLFSRWRLFLFFIMGAMVALGPDVFAHQTPSTIVILDVSPTKVAVELQLPLGELELAFGHDVYKNPDNLVARVGPQLAEYLLAHIHPMVAKDQPWLVDVTDMHVEAAEQTYSGPYQEITVHLIMTPPTGASTRKFIFDYDVIMHQLVTHSALVSIRNDWERGKTDDQPAEVGVIRVDTKTTLIYPLLINLDQGSLWQGFRGMVSLGIEHIAEGTDHLLFLLVLLLPAPLLAEKKRWTGFGGWRYSLIRLLKVVTAFTLGHSLTLLLGALGWVNVPVQPVEILIAFSILVSAIHAWRPLFPGRETYIAASFGLVHGLAFASTLANLNLAPGQMALSILGFNIGIELMQLLVVALTVPWLMLLSQTRVYPFVRTAGAVLAGVAALAWLSERTFGQSNFLTALITKGAGYAPWLIIVLVSASLLLFWRERRQRKMITE
ncbi:HupE/UreJ family protein [Spirosoma pollinicola]|uniref:HupE/UreJ family protein n=1 Tax=Spirosoma pollinicola TaxID=2057025 RepID=A0A2K8Z8C3_9BACT|nr:HupE/UreJ family protein [Spirosoma pollinicola]AUD06108.1 hypothetical protein CWM47_32245 [Spirosoma pollinicola]